jgi:deazaflavin-dependent oxidoreductase (nitroreductase family)
MATRDLARLLRDAEEIQLGVIGRRTGRKRTRPVWFVLEGDTLYLLPVTGSDTEWYKNVLEHPVITVAVKGARWTGRARRITNPTTVRAVVKRFRAKHGAADVKKYYSKLDVALKVSLRPARRGARGPRRAKPR